jgi:hypothetical protein
MLVNDPRIILLALGIVLITVMSAARAPFLSPSPSVQSESKDYIIGLLPHCYYMIQYVVMELQGLRLWPPSQPCG